MLQGLVFCGLILFMFDVVFRGDDPDFASDFRRDLFHHRHARGVDAVVVGQQYAVDHDGFSGSIARLVLHVSGVFASVAATICRAGLASKQGGR